MLIKSINPHDYSEVGQLKVSTETEIKAAVKQANHTKLVWKQTSLNHRIKLLNQLKQLFQKHSKKIAELITKEIGTPITECLDEVEWNFSYWDWFLDHAHEALDPEVTFQDESSTHQVHYEPIGTAAIITPWNLPFDMFVWGVIPNLLVGNTVVYKASEECILTEKLIADIMAESALPKGVFRAIHGSGTQGELLVNQDIDLIWFTGSSAVGKKLYQVAANKFIKAVLEMGGSNPVVVFADADLDLAAKAITAKRCMFTGQTCDADKRLIVEKSIADSLLQKLADSFSELKVGDPQNPDNYMGPLAAKRQLTLLQSQVKDALDKGAKMYYQQTLNKSHQGAYYPPTILTHIKPTMRVWREEVFGPVLPVVTFTSEAEGIELANDTQYGLGSQLFTSDAARANRVARHIEAGNVDVNGVGHFKACNSFGGYKQSGLGREHGIHGLQELCQIKVVAKSK